MQSVIFGRLNAIFFSGLSHHDSSHYKIYQSENYEKKRYLRYTQIDDIHHMTHDEYHVFMYK